MSTLRDYPEVAASDPAFRAVDELHRRGTHRISRDLARRPRIIETTTRLAIDVLVIAAAHLVIAPDEGWLYACNLFVVLLGTRSYVRRLSLRVLDDIRPVGVGLALALAFPVPLSFGSWAPDVETVVGTGLAILAARAVVYAVLRHERRAGRLMERALILGGGQVARRIFSNLEARREFGLVPVGFIDDSNDCLPGPRLGTIQDFARVVDDHDIMQVIVSFGVSRDHTLISALRASCVRGLDVHVVPRLFDVGVNVRHRDSETVWDVPLIRLRRHPVATLTLKRVFDVVVAGAASCVMAPVLLVLALAVRVTSPGPIMFRQLRVGRDGRLFELLKFRSMYENEQSDTEWSVSNPDRLTPIGRFLRRSSLDEVPQIWNVLRGDMSLVGPRPERPFFVDEYSAEINDYRERHRWPVGLTGWAQVHGLRGDTSIHDRARFDNYYIDNWSVFLDLKVLAYTAGETVRYAVRGGHGE